MPFKPAAVYEALAARIDAVRSTASSAALPKCPSFATARRPQQIPPPAFRELLACQRLRILRGSSRQRASGSYSGAASFEAWFGGRHRRVMIAKPFAPHAMGRGLRWY